MTIVRDDILRSSILHTIGKDTAILYPILFCRRRFEHYRERQFHFVPYRPETGFLASRQNLAP